MFLAQIGHESGDLKYTEENLNYSGERLLVVFPKYFGWVDVGLYARKPEKIANRVYANRMGNGPEASGDGYRYRGRGLIQLTGFNNYSEYAKSLGIGVKETADYVSTPIGAVSSAGWFWKTRGLNAIADPGDILTSTKIINGGTNGLAERTALYNKALQIIT
jgi:putative chitinase